MASPEEKEKRQRRIKNKIAKDLFTPKYKQRRKESKKKYDRKKIDSKEIEGWVEE